MTQQHREHPAQAGHLIRVTEQEILPLLRRTIPRYHLLEFARTPSGPRLRLLAPNTPAGAAAATLTRRPDGTLQCQLREGANSNTLRIDQLLRQDQVTRPEDLAYRILRELAQRPDTRSQLLWELAKPESPSSLLNTLSDLAQRENRDFYETSILPSGPRQLLLSALPSSVRRIIKQQFTDAQAINLVQELTGIKTHQVTISAYNAVLTAHTPLRTLIQQGRHLLAQAYIVTTPTDPQEEQHPPPQRTEDIQHILRHRLGLSPSALETMERSPDHVQLPMDREQAHQLAAAAAAMAALGTQDTQKHHDISQPSIAHHASQIREHHPNAWPHCLQLLDHYSNSERTSRDYTNLRRQLAALHPETPGPSPTPGSGQQPAGQQAQHQTDPRQEARRVTLEAAAPVAARTPPWTPMRLRQDQGGASLDLLIQAGREPRLSFQLSQDRTINFSRNGRLRHHTLRIDHREMHIPFLHQTAHRILLTAIRQQGQDTILRMAAQTPFFHPALQRAAHQAITQAALPSEVDLPDGTRRQYHIDVNNIPTRATNILHTRLADPDTAATAQRLFHHQNQDGCTTKTYNTVALNRQLFERMQRENPHVLAYHSRYLTDPAGPPVRHSHPGKIVHAVRTDLKLTNMEWRLFSRLPLPDTRSTHQEARDTIRTTCRALAQANRPRAPQHVLEDVGGRTHLHHFFSEAQWQHGDPWRAWTHLLNRYLGQPHPDPRELLRVTDALTGHIRENIPWGPGSWHTIQNRSERWHQDPGSQNRNARWHSALETTRLGDLTLTPVTTGESLHQLGQSMNNCLATYSAACQESSSRIFTAHRGDQLEAAIELTRHGRTWSTGQVEAPDQGPLAPDIGPAVSQLVRLYQEAQDRQEHPERQTRRDTLPQPDGAAG